MKNRIITITTLLFFLFPALSFAQTSHNMNGTTTVTGCNLLIYDNGGPTGDYGNNRNDIMTIMSDDPSNPAIQVQFLEADIEPGDTLFIYNSATPDPAFGVLMGPLGVPWYNETNAILPIEDWSYRATIENPSGAITLRFKTNGSATRAGFKIKVTCGTLCQPILAHVDTLLSVPPIYTSKEDGYRYMDFCPYDVYAIFQGYGEFPYNDQGGYHQSNDSCEFIWHINGEVIQGVGKDTVHYSSFLPRKGSDVRLEMKDQRGCPSTFVDYIRVRVSDNPVSSVSFPGDRGYACVGDIIDFSTGYSGGDLITVDTIKNTMTSSQSFDSLLYIPDGPNWSVNCDPGGGTCYLASVVFTDFSPGQTITDVNDIISICFTMEHSYLHDLNFTVICPNGQSARLYNDHGSGGGNRLGDANESDASGCNPSDPGPSGWNYCWSENTSLGFGYAGPSPHGLDNGPTVTNSFGNTTVDSTNRVTNTNYFRPATSFSQLIGCPMNGTWSLQICDTWGVDDGWIWSWQLNLSPELLPAPWDYEVTIESVDWTGHNINQITPTLYQVTCDEAGLFRYTYAITDNFNCIYQGTDTVELNVISLPTPDLGEDTWICDGKFMDLDPNYSEPNTTYYWNTGDETEILNIVVPGSYSVTISTYSDDKSKVCIGQDEINIDFHLKPVPDFTIDPDEGCVPLSFTVHNATNTNGELCTYRWMVGYAGSEVESPSFIISQPGNYDVKLVAISEFGCTDSTTRYGVIKVHNQPVADFIPDPEVALYSEKNGEVVFHNSSSGFDPGDVTWEWDFGDGGEASDLETPTYVYSDWGDYDVKLIVISSHGCSDTVTRRVIIESDLEFPNFITPNGDGYNDVFAIKNLNTDRENMLTVYDRWGRKVYEQKRYQTYMKDDQLFNASTGFDAEKLSDGVYYFVFYYKGYAKEVNYHGSLTIIRD